MKNCLEETNPHRRKGGCMEDTVMAFIAGWGLGFALNQFRSLRELRKLSKRKKVDCSGCKLYKKCLFPDYCPRTDE